MNIKLKLTLLFFSVSFIVLLSGYVSTEIIESKLRDATGRNVAGLATRIIQDIDESIHTRIEELELYILQGLVIDDIQQSNNAYKQLESPQAYINEKDKAWQTVSKETITPFMASITETALSKDLRDRITYYQEKYGYQVFGEIFLTNKYGANVAQSGKTSDFKQSDETWWVGAKENGLFVGDVEFDRSANIYSLDIALPIEDEKGAFIGVLKAVLDLREVRSIIDEIKTLPEYEIHPSMSATIVNKENEIIYSTQPTNIFDPHSVIVSDELITGQGEYFVYTGRALTGFAVSDYEESEIYDWGNTKQDGGLVAVAISNGVGSYEGLGWSVIIEHETEEVLSPIKDLERILITVSIIAMLVSVLFGLLVSRGISQPIKDIEQFAKKISAGELDTKMRYRKGGTEIASLVCSLNDMSRSLKRYQEELLKSEKQKGKELEAEVKRQTKELDKKVIELEKARAATINVLEDMDKANKDLKKLDKAKSEFLNIVSHELKTPLTAIIAYLDILADASEKHTPEELKSLDAIKRNSKSLNRLIGNILEIARMESGKFELIKKETDIQKLIAQTLADIQSISDQKGLKLLSTVEKMPPVLIDPQRMGEVITNLVSNAIKFTEKGNITVNARLEKDQLHFEVSDTGVGIPKEHINSLFTKFYQVDASISRKYGGTGLGLAITKKIIEAHGGKITVKSTPGKGTTFTFHIQINDSKQKTR